MKGYCETCQKEVPYFLDLYDVPICMVCEGDVNLDVHLEWDDFWGDRTEDWSYLDE